jgi:hypothetical protein
MSRVLMGWDEFEAGMRRLGATFGVPTSEMVESYYEALADEMDGATWQAVTRRACKAWTGFGLPRPADLLEYATEIRLAGRGAGRFYPDSGFIREVASLPPPTDELARKPTEEEVERCVEMLRRAVAGEDVARSMPGRAQPKPEELEKRVDAALGKAGRP